MFTAISANITSTINRFTRLNKPDLELEERIAELKSGIEESRAELSRVLEDFNNVTEPKLIDFCIYRIQSEQSRYEQLLMEYRSIYKPAAGEQI